MVDNGFTVDNLCNENDVLLIRPPFFKDKTCLLGMKLYKPNDQ